MRDARMHVREERRVALILAGLRQPELVSHLRLVFTKTFNLQAKLVASVPQVLLSLKYSNK